MPPPPVTPSPHRFIIKKPQQSVRRTPLVAASTPRSSAPQFNATPRFTFASTPRPAATQTLLNCIPFTPGCATPGPGEVSDREGIEDDTDDPPRHGYESIEGEGQDGDDDSMPLHAERGDKLEERDLKRRRLSSSPAQDEDIDLVPWSPLPVLPSPLAKIRGVSTAPRFLPATSGTGSNPQVAPTQGQTFLRPPRFRPPDPAEQTQSQIEPLPEQFSPHRRGQKYVPGGLAAEVRGWLFNIESTLPSTSVHRYKEEPWTFKLVVDEVNGEEKAGFTLVRGRQIYKEDPELEDVIDELGKVKMLLAGEGAGTSIQKGARIAIGGTVGVKGPTWEILLDRIKWGVGTDWKVLH